MSAGNIHDAGPPENLTHRTTKEGLRDNSTLSDVTLTKGFPERSAEEKLALLRALIKRKYAL